MSTIWLNYIPRTLFVLGILLGVFIGIPVCFAGGAVTIVQDQKQLAPRGSYIPERRVQQVLKKVQEHKAMMKEKETMEGEKQLPENETDKPKSSEEK
jgi:hypothetical protein